ncbi:MAG TPA: hypothetical protein VIH16_04185, partial [Bellilinea sp.]
MSAIISPTRRSVLPVYRTLVTWYPTPFRQRFEQEMLLAFQDWLNAEPTPRSKAQQLKLASSLIADMLPSIIQEHLSEWRSTMKVSSIIQKVALAALAAWAVIWAWFIGKWFLLLPLADPNKWLLGEDYSSTANSIFGAALFIIPFLALLAFVIPVLKIQTLTENGDGVL